MSRKKRARREKRRKENGKGLRDSRDRERRWRENEGVTTSVSGKHCGCGGSRGCAHCPLCMAQKEPAALAEAWLHRRSSHLPGTAHTASPYSNRRSRPLDRVMQRFLVTGWIRAAGWNAGRPAKDAGAKWQGGGQGHREEGQA